eukprot:PhM_4_TR16723/c0_g1_i1/m.83338/K11344/EAF6; chromatin modification-related protein EAF6
MSSSSSRAHQIHHPSNASTPRSIEDVRSARKQLQQELEKVESQLYKLEGNYLQSCLDVGTILDGWTAYSKLERGAKKRRTFSENDRVFTLSSSTGYATANKFGLVPSSSSGTSSPLPSSRGKKSEN